MTNTIDYTSLKRLPVGISEIDTVRLKNYYYVDKTPYIKELFKNNGSQVLLIARPRRFGKSLAMDTFYKFLRLNPQNPDDTSFQEAIFKGTKIYEDQEFCKEYMGKFPVISISLKTVSDNTFTLTRNNLAEFIADIANSHDYLLSSPLFTKKEKASFEILEDGTKLGSKKYQSKLEKSLLILTNMLCRYHGKKVVVLIDEYDVPLANAYEYGFYQDMVGLIRNLFFQCG